MFGFYTCRSGGRCVASAIFVFRSGASTNIGSRVTVAADFFDESCATSGPDLKLEMIKDVLHLGPVTKCNV
jgi:hypothetical protein